MTDLLRNARRLRLVAVLLFAAALCLVLLGRPSAGFFSGRAQAPRDKKAPAPTNPYDPAQYGVPETIAGYKVLAVLTPENSACMSSGRKQLVLQASQSTLEEYLEVSRPGDISQALEQHGLVPDEWTIEITGPGATLQAITEGNERWNELSKRFGCIHLGPIEISDE